MEKSIELGEPVIYVAVNYRSVHHYFSYVATPSWLLCRLYVMGFLGGAEIKDAGLGNLGLQDRESGWQVSNNFKD